MLPSTWETETKPKFLQDGTNLSWSLHFRSDGGGGGAPRILTPRRSAHFPLRSPLTSRPLPSTPIEGRTRPSYGGCLDPFPRRGSTAFPCGIEKEGTATAPASPAAWNPGISRTGGRFPTTSATLAYRPPPPPPSPGLVPEQGLRMRVACVAARARTRGGRRAAGGWQRLRAGRGRRLAALLPQVLCCELGGGLPLRARDRKQQLFPKFWQRPVPVSQVWELNTGLRGEGAAKGRT